MERGDKSPKLQEFAEQKNHGSSTKIKDPKASSTPWTPELSNFHHKEQDKRRWRGDPRAGDDELLIKHEYQDS